MGSYTGKGSHTRPQSKGPTQHTGRWVADKPGTPLRLLPVTMACADQLLEQYQALGIAQTEAARLLQLSCSALNRSLADIDACAYSSAPVTEQVSMLLPRFDIDNLAKLIGISTAQVQSAVAMLTLEYVVQLHTIA